MSHYEPNLRLKCSSLATKYHRLIAYRNAAWMLESLAETAEEKQAIKDLPVEPRLYGSELYTRLIQRMHTFFCGAFDDPFDDTGEEECAAFHFYTFHSVDEEDGLYDSEYLTLLYRLLTGCQVDPQWILETGIDWGFPLPETIPAEGYSLDYVEDRITALRLAPSLKSGLLSLFHASNFMSDNPFVCLYEEVPYFVFEWGHADLCIEEFEQLKQTWLDAQPIIHSCCGLLEIFRDDAEQAVTILRHLWRSIFVPTNPISKEHPVLPFDPPLWVEPDGQ